MNPPIGLIVGITVLALALPFFVSLLVALRPESKPEDERDYFLFGRNLDSGTFASSSVGYSTQVAAIFLFLYWFFTYGLWALAVPVFWGAGYFFVGWLVQRKKLDEFLVNTSAVETLHGYIGKVFAMRSSPKSVRILVMIASISTILGLGGALVTEVDYATRYFILPGLGLPTDPDRPANLIIAQLLILAFAGCYVLLGGYKAAILTDKLQIRIAYASMAGATLFLAVKAMFSSNSLIGILATILLIVIFSWFHQRRQTLHQLDTRYLEYKHDARMYRILIVAATAVLLYELYLLSTGVAVVGYDASILPRSNGNMFGFGLLGLASLGVANFFWQLIDLSCMQRLQSVTFTGSLEDRNRIVAGLRASGVESFGIWILTIIFAALIKSLGGSYDYIGALALSSGSWNWAIIVLIAFFISSFMLSTLDCLISGSAYVAYYDLARPNVASFSEETQSLERRMFVPRILTGMFLLVAFGGYWLVLKQLDSAQVPLVLYGFYAVQASIFILVVVALFLRRYADALAGVLAVAAGWCAALFSAISPPKFGIIADSWGVIPPLSAVLVSALVYFAIVFIKRFYQTS